MQARAGIFAVATAMAQTTDRCRNFPIDTAPEEAEHPALHSGFGVYFLLAVKRGWNMALFHVFRLKVIRGAQGYLFHDDLDRRTFLQFLLLRKPSHELRSGYVWHVGNLQPIDKDGFLFAIGRKTTASKERYDESTGDFIQVNDEESPFTYALYDMKYSVLAITPKSKLAPTTKGIANSIEKLFNADPYTSEFGVKIEVRQIPDPESFIKQLYSAFAVIGFTMEFSEPNPFDVEKDFHKPMEHLLENTGGNKGSTKVSGSDLNRDSLESLSRSVASVGNDASAKIRRAAGDRPMLRHLKGDPAGFTVEGENIQADRSIIFQKLRETYQRIRMSSHGD